MYEIDTVFENQRSFYHTNVTKNYDFRIDALKKLRSAILSHESKINAALQEDLNKSEFDSYTTEIGFALEEISFTIKRLHQWMKPKGVKTALTHFGTKGVRYPEPLGVVLIIAPWNYPFQLAISPLIGAIAAGNCAIIKPSEISTATSKVIFEMLTTSFDAQFIAVFEGGIEISEALLKLPFNHIFFTGSPSVGKIVMSSAAQHLTPVTLELGGKSPCIVHRDADLALAAKRIAWGKFVNAGQTCVAPDFLYIDESIAERFVRLLRKAIHELYTDNALENRDYSRIVSTKHFDRLCQYLKDGNIIEGGKVDASNLKIQPTLISEINWESPIMQEEIFGPLLPIMTYHNLGEAIEKIKSLPHPLAFYFFGKDKKIIRNVLREVEFGGGCINDTLFHIATPYLPFGGKGHSGMGAYHGKASFDCFTHYKSVLRQTNLFDLPFRYPSFKNRLNWIKRILK